jgi:hypothetical protein
MSELSDIEIYNKQDARDHLVFIRKPIEGLETVDVGRLLSEWLRQQDLNSQFLQMEVNDQLDEILSQEYKRDDIGDYLVITNIGILFEPALQINTRALLERHSDRKLIIVLSDGVVDKEGRNYYFLLPSDNYSIDLSGLSYYSCN